MASQAPIGIVGGGPVGMMLALFLARYGVASVLFNRETHTRFHPKGSTHNARSMEHYRRLGFSTEVRGMGLPADHPTDVAYFTRLGGYELARIRMPTEAERMAVVAASPVTHQVPEPIHRANQMYVEKFLHDRVIAEPLVMRRYGWRVAALQQDKDGVDVTAERTGGTGAEPWRFQYLVGCDGGQSFVRRALGFRYGGFENLQQKFMGGRMLANYLRIPTMLQQVIGRDRRAWQYTVINDEQRMVLVSLNGEDEFLLFTRAPDPDTVPDDDAVRRYLQSATRTSVPIEVLGHTPWTAGVALVAERFGEGRVMLAGDAVHLFTPTGGFGMNTGIDDAANLSWKLAAMVQGWGGAGLVATYEPERRPVAVRNTTAARALAVTIGEMPAGPTLDQASPEGEAARQQLGAFLEASLGEEFASLGVQLGARYDGSAIVAEDGAPPADDPVTYVPSSVPGGRAPHFWMDAGRGIGSSLYDRLGLGFTLLCLGRDARDAAAFAAASRARGIPLDILCLEDDAARELYQRDFALIRPDQHVAWRGNQIPNAPEQLLERVIGAATG